MVNAIKSIEIENVKGKDRMFLNTFANGIIANYANILVAHNGFGKSTLSTAFEALKSNKIELNKEDRYYQNNDAKPMIKIEFVGKKQGIYTADESKNEFYQNDIDIAVIKSSIYAKDTSRAYMGRTTKSADIRVKTIGLCKVVKKPKITYSVMEYSKKKNIQRSNCINIKNFLSDIDFISTILENKTELGKYTQVRVNRLLDGFSKCPTDDNADKALANKTIGFIAELVKKLNDKNLEHDDKKLLYRTIQLFDFYNDHKDVLPDWLKYLQYEKIKSEVNEDLALFDTTNKRIRCSENRTRLEIDLGTAHNMSNGERDVLSFIGNLKKYEFSLKHEHVILVIDEVFDYLDGSNMLAVQFYLSKLIEKFKITGRYIYPIILTHLDPIMFKNYYLQKQKVHYLENTPAHDVNEWMLQLLKDRNKENSKQNEDIKKFEQSFIHYYPHDVELNSCGNKISKCEFYQKIDKTLEACCSGKNFDPLEAIAAIRIKIEKYLYDRMEDESKDEIIDIHKTKNKLNFAESKEVDIPFEFYLLAPLYNESLHISNYDEEIKIKSCYLKLSNGQVRHIIKSMCKKCSQL